MAGIEELKAMVKHVIEGGYLDKKQLAQIFKEYPASGKLYRAQRESRMPELLEEGFSKARQAEGSMTISGEEPKGLYYARDPLDVPPLRKGVSRSAYDPEGLRRAAANTINIEAIPHPDATHLEFSADDWKSYIKERLPNKGRLKTEDYGQQRLTEDLQKRGDFIDIPDIAAGSPDMVQTVQMNPGKSLAKIRHGGRDHYKVLDAAFATTGATGAVLAGNAAMPEDADAAIYQQFGKAAKGMLKKMKKAEPSSSMDMLPGRKLPAFGEDATIESVSKLGGDRRAIKLTDGRVFSASKEDLHHLSSMYGTEDQMNTFKEAAHDHRVTMAQNSLKYNESRTRYFQTAAGLMPNRTMRREIVEDWVKEMSRYSDSPALTEQAFVQSRETKKWFLMPKDYAEILDRMGFIWYNKSATKAIREEAIGTQKRWKK